jgi:hypothetical protein
VSLFVVVNFFLVLIRFFSSVTSQAGYAPSAFAYVLQAPGMIPQQMQGMTMMPQQQYQYQVQNPMFIQQPTQNGMSAFPDGSYQDASMQYAAVPAGMQGQAQSYRRYPMVTNGMPMNMTPAMSPQMSRQPTLVRCLFC